MLFRSPFVHALDTAEGRARCVDLAVLAHRPTAAMRLTVGADGAALTVLDGGAPVAEIDTATYQVSAATAAAVPSTDTRGGHVLLLAIGLGLAALLGAGVVTLLWRRRGRAPPGRAGPSGAPLP